MQGQSNDLKKLQRKLRNRMTDAERALWQILRNRQMDGCKFRRQHPYCGYILDFVCLETMLVLEVDGGQHGFQKEYDQQRTDVLERAGFHVLRFWNNDVLQKRDAVKEKIWMTVRGLRKPSPSQPPP